MNMWTSYALVLALSAIPSATFAETAYFPPGVWDDSKSAIFYERWFGDQLKAMKEKPLWIERHTLKADMSVRLLFLPSFDHSSILQLSFYADGRVIYEFKDVTGKGGYDPGTLRSKSEAEVDAQSIDAINALLDIIEPLTGHTPTEAVNFARICTDGTKIVLEFSGQGKYIAITRHECDMDSKDPLRQFVRLLNDIAEEKIIQPDTFNDWN